MGALIGLTAGVGLFLIWWACWEPAPRLLGLAGRSPVGRLRALLDEADLPSVSPTAFLAVCAGTGSGVGLVVLAFTGVLPVTGCFAAIAGWAPYAAARGRARRRRQRFRELWPDVVDNLASGVRAGLSLPEALGALGERGPEPLRPPFRAFARDYRLTGSFGDSLEALKSRLADPVGDRLCEALRITREVGGSDLGRLLRNLSMFLRDDARVRSELEARQSWTVSAARLAVSAPWLVLALLASKPESVQAYESSTGTVVLAVGAGASVFAYRLMTVIGRLPEEQRVLR
ncbi:type II secretion system F family protein [Kineosporia sp. NBRC 101731]|uniref:type II secretion system F family protein n=1 Tax=Kineosporia sp. NBRC 101731 TaxID=3032199 RepID=UPI0024A2C1D0|nr:type II secretion system F family protein [Kineosporia sp. NBRC 101731]GLY28405.1 type II secretion system protein F [Kineosporia sp. NBRC 101731]